MTRRSIPGNCSRSNEVTITSTPMRLCTNVEMQPGAVDHVDVAEITFLLLVGAIFFFTLSDKASDYVKTFCIKTNEEARNY